MNEWLAPVSTNVETCWSLIRPWRNMSPEPRFPHPIRKLALATKPPSNNGFNLSLGVDALIILGQSFFMWPFLPHPKHASLSLGGLRVSYAFGFLPFGTLLGLGSNFSCICLSFLRFLRSCHELLSLPTLAALTSPPCSFLSTASSPNLFTIRMRSCRLSGN